MPESLVISNDKLIFRRVIKVAENTYSPATCVSIPYQHSIKRFKTLLVEFSYLFKAVYEVITGICQIALYFAIRYQFPDVVYAKILIYVVDFETTAVVF